eukprot:NODE_903_length_1123_cov_43.325301_g861_i0.p1 GENE.NODE_903_length_1123_cov_43.325301_g861_i0~~NODE_903_length_1123_cov_43.325301_g861_i0.p1  ORF type:complete len:161 (+),score=10.85 NODE_903_length_1123_cov_43.325301_g861_i0:128-610(+)
MHGDGCPEPPSTPLVVFQDTKYTDVTCPAANRNSPDHPLACDTNTAPQTLDIEISLVQQPAGPSVLPAIPEMVTTIRMYPHQGPVEAHPTLNTCGCKNIASCLNNPSERRRATCEPHADWVCSVSLVASTPLAVSGSEGDPALISRMYPGCPPVFGQQSR